MEQKAYVSWKAMKSRCRRTDAGFPDLKSYHGKSITVCERWLRDFPAFVADMGLPPSAIHSIDRKRNAEGYSPDNCRWATPQEQAINRSTTVFITINGRTETLAEWSRISGVKMATIRWRMLNGRANDELLVGDDIFYSPAPRPRKPGGGRPKGSKNKYRPKTSVLTDAPSAPQASEPCKSALIQT